MLFSSSIHKNFNRITFFVFFLVYGVLFSQKTFNPMIVGEKINFLEIQKIKDSEYKDVPDSLRRGWKQYKRWEYFWEQRTFPTGEFPNGISIYKEFKNSLDSYNAIKESEQLQSNAQWTSVGPFKESIDNNLQSGVGRLNIVRFHPTNPNELWVGAASGGVWRSKDDGATWETFPFTQFLSLGVNDIAISPSNPNIIYVGTGDAFGSAGTRDFYSIGVIKTTDAGQTWEVTSLSKNLHDKRLIGRVLVHPTNPNIVLAATNDGIYKTTDGGKSWEIKDKTAYFIDMEFHPLDPEIIYASTFNWGSNNGIYVSNDGGETWVRKTQISGSVRIAIEVTPAAPDMVYALVARSNFTFLSFNVSEDKGENWLEIADYNKVGNILGRSLGNLNTDNEGQGQYDLCLAVSPKDPNLVFIGGINIWKTTDLGASFQLVTHWYGGYQKPYVHADIHDLKFKSDGNTIYTTNDGGINRTTNQGNTWKALNDGLNITQFYKISVFQSNIPVIIGGTQDNGSKLYQNNTWYKVQGGDGMECIIDPTNKNRMYASFYNGSFTRSTDGGTNFSTMLNMNKTGEYGGWVAPLAMDPQRTNVLYAGYENVWKNINYGSYNGWTKISSWGQKNVALRCIAVAPSDTNVIYASNMSTIYATFDGGTTWNVVYGSSEAAVSNIIVDYTNPKRIWVTHSGYVSKLKIVEVNTDTKAILNITGNLPNVPVNALILQKNSPDRMYIGTDIGMFYSDYSSANWLSYGTGLPNVIINDLEINEKSNELIAGTYGRGIWKAPLLNCNEEMVEIEAKGNTKFCHNESVELTAKEDYPTYLWSNGATTKTISVSDAGAYSLMVKGSGDCDRKSKAIIVEKYPFDTIQIQRIHDFICVDGTKELVATIGFEKYIWNTGDTTRTIYIDKPGIYTVKGFTKEGCELESAELLIQEKAPPAKPVISQHQSSLISSEAMGYQWYQNGKKLPGKNQRTIVLDDTRYGKYTVMITDEYGCTSISDEFDFNSADVNYDVADNVRILPNPSNGIFTLSMNLINNSSYLFDISDLSGKVLYSFPLTYKIGSINQQIDITNFANGTYLLNLNVNGNPVIYKLIKQ